MKWGSPIVLSTGNCCPPVYEMCDHTPEGSVHLAGTHSNRCCIHLHRPERKQKSTVRLLLSHDKTFKMCHGLCNWYQQAQLKICDHSIKRFLFCFLSSTETTQDPPPPPMQTNNTQSWPPRPRWSIREATATITTAPLPHDPGWYGQFWHKHSSQYSYSLHFLLMHQNMDSFWKERKRKKKRKKAKGNNLQHSAMYGASTVVCYLP